MLFALESISISHGVGHNGVCTSAAYVPDDFRLKGIFRNIFSGRWARRDISELRYIYDLISLTSAPWRYILTVTQLLRLLLLFETKRLTRAYICNTERLYVQNRVYRSISLIDTNLNHNQHKE